MATIKLLSIRKTEACINFHVNLDKRGSVGYESGVALFHKEGEGWTAHMTFNDMPAQETPEQAIDRMGLYLREMAKTMKGKNIKHLNIGTLFNSIHK